MRDIIKGYPIIKEISSIVGRNSGRFRFIEAEVKLRTANLEKAFKIKRQVEEEIRRQIPHVESINLNFKPSEKEMMRFAAPVINDAGEISEHFGEAPLFAIISIHRQKQEERRTEFLENEHKATETAKGIKVAEWLVRQNVDYLFIKEDISRKGPGYVLSSAGVEVKITEAASLQEIDFPSFI